MRAGEQAMGRLVAFTGVTALAERTARRYCEHGLASRGVPEPPRASLAHGAGGVAYFLFRYSNFGGGQASLEAAAQWASHAQMLMGKPDAFVTRGDPMSSSPGWAVHYHEPGVWWVKTLVAAEQKEQEQLRQAVGKFAKAAARVRSSRWDVNLGTAGLLLGCAQVLESVEDRAVCAPVRAVGERLAADLLVLVEREGAAPGETALGYLGAAHGWAGVAQALLRWGGAIAEPPAGQVLGLLDHLAGLRRPSGRWPVRAGSRGVYRGWCHGSAGWAQMWALAWQATEDERLLGFAEGCAEDAAAADGVPASLCCGRAGQGFAALTLYRVTGERRWLTEAQNVVADAMRRPDGLAPAHQLFAGDLGVALLAAELEDPARSAMPVFETLGRK
jgi:eukaryotic-like serine/threonine-protein kinase